MGIAWTVWLIFALQGGGHRAEIKVDDSAALIEVQVPANHGLRVGDLCFVATGERVGQVEARVFRRLDVFGRVEWSSLDHFSRFLRHRVVSQFELASR